MASQSLEQSLELVPTIKGVRMYKTIDVYVAGTTALYTGKILIYDFPGSGGQVHLHQNDLGFSGGRVYPYGREVFKPLNAYEAAMFEYRANQLGCKPIKIIDDKKY